MKKIKSYVVLIVFALLVILIIKAGPLGFEFLSVTKYDGSDIALEVEQGMGASQLGQKLEDMGVLKSKYTFIARYKLLPDDRSAIYFGDHIIKKGMSVGDILELVTTMPQNADTITVSIPEGYSVQMIATKMEEQGLCTYDEFIEALGDSYDYEFISHIPESGYKYRLEGFLFPDTYEFYETESAHGIIDKMLSAFEREYRSNFSSYDNMFEIVTTASIVEREAVIDSERATIAGVIKNRIESNMLLQVDATVVYAKSLGMYDMTQVTYKDLEVSSPYNTYKNKGLPPGPICNAGIKSIIAAANPENHEWLFYHTDEVKKDGSHIFTKTFDEHVSTMN